METDEPLETGYRPQAPPGDNACNDFAQGLADAYAALARARGDAVLDDDVMLLADAASPSFFGNVAVMRQPLSERGWSEAAARMASFYAERAGGPFLVFSAWPTADLTALGFGLVGHPPLMLRPPAPVTAAAVDGVEIRPVEDADSAPDWEWAFVHGFPIAELQPFRPSCILPPGALAAERWRHWVAYADGRPVGTASAYLADRHLQVEYIATVEAARRRGIGRALTATATAAAAHQPAMLIASDPGRPVYERLGYLPILRFTLWEGARQAPP